MTLAKERSSNRPLPETNRRLNMGIRTWASFRIHAVNIWTPVFPITPMIWRWPCAFTIFANNMRSNPAISAELDRIFTNIVSGQVSMANLQLTGMESNRPVIYNLSYDGSQLQFLIGGYVASSVQVQMSTDLTDWQTVQTFPASANLSVFSTATAQTRQDFSKSNDLHLRLGPKKSGCSLSTLATGFGPPAG